MVCQIEPGGSGLPEDVCRTLLPTRKNFNDRPVYEGDDDIALYYWQEEGWPSGWWLGYEVGGEQVYAFNQCDSLDAPIDGWRCPWHLGICDSFQILHEEPSESERSLDPYTSWLVLLQFCSGVSSKSMLKSREAFQAAFAQFIKFKEIMFAESFDSSELVTHAGNFYEEKQLIDDNILPTHAPKDLLSNSRSVVHKDLLRILAFEAVVGNKLLSGELSVVAKVLAHFRFEKDFSKGVHDLINNLKSVEKGRKREREKVA